MYKKFICVILPLKINDYIMLKNLLSKIGIGAAKVDTQLNTLLIYPGSYLLGTTIIQGGMTAQVIDDIYLHFNTSAQLDGHYNTIEFYKVKIADRFTINAREEKRIPFHVPTPFELPITMVNEQYAMPYNGLYIRTAMDIAYALDAADSDRFDVEPHPAIDKVLQAVEYLGFDLYKVDIYQEQLQGSQLPFFQGFEYHAYRTAYGNQVDALEIVFLGRQTECEVILRINPKNAFFKSENDKYNHFLVSYTGYERIDMADILDRAIRNAI
jgi:sporulation-control protein